MDINKLRDEIEEIQEAFVVVCGEVEGISAATQQLSAGLQESSEAVDVVTMTAVQLEQLAKNISERAELAAEQVLEIHRRAEKAKHETHDGWEYALQVRKNVCDKMKEQMQTENSINAETKNLIKELLHYMEQDVEKSYKTFRDLSETYTIDACYMDDRINEFYEIADLLETSVGAISKAMKGIISIVEHGAEGIEGISEQIQTIAVMCQETEESILRALDTIEPEK